SSHGEPVRELRSLSNPIELAAGEYVLELSRADWLPLTLLAKIEPGDTTVREASLLPDSPISAGMVLVPAGPAPAGVGGLPIEAFLIDRHEVTNREYARFMADDGYRTATLWRDSMTVDGKRLARAEAISSLSDLTGAPGPRLWSGSVFPAGSADHPVTGVSWYEANAYCLWEGKRLPTATQWWRAALGDGDKLYPSRWQGMPGSGYVASRRERLRLPAWAARGRTRSTRFPSSGESLCRSASPTKPRDSDAFVTSIRKQDRPLRGAFSGHRRPRLRSMGIRRLAGTAGR
ncbi:MAG: SUMF1/EgtB/PvdO family nonheme iron enzyme, partial [Gemmatimonadota bacterium]